MIDKIKNLRRFFRLPYPKAAEPPLTVNKDTTYRVLEISERGILLAQKSDAPLQLGETLRGNIRFHDQHSEEIEGQVYRLDPRGVIITLSQGISPKYMMQEQIYVRNTFPVFFRYTIRENFKASH
ncbi:PilZ domain-containing protein [Zhongshania sp.]|uniref:PilZ domain-containing protein n=1 Tax=Zhongshania sp. TaxID=1971902 RepID=UPI003561C6EC